MINIILNNDNNSYVDVVYIPNYKTSVYMNSLFRNIRENNNLDYKKLANKSDIIITLMQESKFIFTIRSFKYILLHIDMNDLGTLFGQPLDFTFSP